MKILSFKYNTEHLHNIGLFKEMSSEFLESVVSKHELVYFDPGEKYDIPSYPNDTQSDIWILTHSEASVSLVGEKDTIFSKSLCRGDGFCNFYGTTGNSHHWVLSSYGPCILMKISISPKDKYLNPEYALLVSRIIRSSIMSQQKSRKHEELKRIAIIPTQPAEFLDIDAFIEDLTPFFHSLGKTLLLTPNNVNEVLQLDGSKSLDWGNKELMFKLITVENNYDYSLYIPNKLDENWIQFCLINADRILFLADGDKPVTLNPIAQHCINIMEKGKTKWSANLALVHQAVEKEAGHVNEWKSLLNVERHYHVRWKNKSDMGRLIRLLTGNATALVLGAGAGRGVTHIGVYKALQEANIPIDIIAGTSVGALIGSWLARGTSWEHCQNTVINFLENLSTLDIAFPVLSMIDEETYKAIAEEYLGKENIEDYLYNYFCVAVSLQNTEAVIHQQGIGMDTIISSSALPGIFPPIEVENDLLVDGGLMEPLPVVPMINLYNPAYIIAVDVTTEVTMKVSDYQPTPLESLWGAVTGKKKRSKYTLIDIVLRMCELNSTRSRSNIVDNHLADLLLRPNIDQIAMIPNPENVPSIVENTYNLYSPQTKKWREEIAKKVPLFDDLK